MLRQGVFNEQTLLKTPRELELGCNKDLVTTNDRIESESQNFSIACDAHCVRQNFETITTYKLGFFDELELFRCTTATQN